MSKREIAGARSDHREGPVYATEDGGQLTFTALLRSGDYKGELVTIRTPIFKPEDIRTFVARRMTEFKRRPGGRESPQQAVIRKSIAAQGNAAIAQARHLMSEGEKMELDMMLSKDSHGQGMPFNPNAKPITVSRNGMIGGLNKRQLYPA